MPVMEDRTAPHRPTETTRSRLAGLRLLRELAQEGPAPGATARQHARGEFTARERIELPLDPGAFGCALGEAHTPALIRSPAEHRDLPSREHGNRPV
ncbi:hypothetical protein ABZ845_18575 [Streptomyces sp. NPDC047022]|uniref:hypothetical protein n=1 Tax=Streptomyces sp. NPDC047022 TaxID=3155737 RepID=UPI0033EF97DF